MAIEAIAWGTREAMVAELAAFDPTTIGIPEDECAFLVMPIGPEQYDPEWFATAEEAMEAAKGEATSINMRMDVLDDAFLIPVRRID